MTGEREGRPAGGWPAWTKTVATVAVPVMVAILVTALSPLGETLRELVFPTSAAGQGTIMLSGSPLSGAQILIDGEQEGASDSDGSFLITGLEKGEHELRVDALGARSHDSRFFVAQGSNSVDLGLIELTPSLRLAGDIQVALDVERLATDYDVAVWLEGDEEMLSRTTRVTYVVSHLSATPTTAIDRAAKFCSRFAGSLALPDVPRGPVEAIVELNDGTSLRLALTELQQIEPGARPAACNATAVAPTTSTPVPPATETTSPTVPPPTIPDPTEPQPTDPGTSVPDTTIPDVVTIACSPAGGTDVDATAGLGAEVRWENESDESMTLDFANNALDEPVGDIDPGKSYAVTPVGIGQVSYTCVFSEQKQSGVLDVVEEG